MSSMLGLFRGLKQKRTKDDESQQDIEESGEIGLGQDVSEGSDLRQEREDLDQLISTQEKQADSILAELEALLLPGDSEESLYKSARMSEEPPTISQPLLSKEQMPNYSTDEGSASGIDKTTRAANRTFPPSVDGGGIPVAPAPYPGSYVVQPPFTTLSQAKKKKKKKKPEVLLNYNSAMELEYQVQMNLVKHHLAGQYYGSRQFWFFTIPQGLLTMIASILAFIASGCLFSSSFKSTLATIVGSTSGVVVFLQTMSGVCDYGTRASMHQSAAIDLRDLRDHIVLMKFKLKKADEDEPPPEEDDESLSKQSKKSGEGEDEDEDGDDEDAEDEAKKAKEDDNTFSRIQQRYRQSLSGCKSNIPMALSEAFQGMQSNLYVSDSLDNNMYMREIYGPKKNFKNIVHFKAFDILSSMILNYWMFPLFLPNPAKICNYAMAHLNEELKRYHNYWDDQLEEARADAIEEAMEDAKNDEFLPDHLRQSRRLDDLEDL